MTDSPLRPLSRWQTAGWVLAGTAAFHAAFFWETAGIVIVFYLAAMFYLPRISTTRQAFYLGFLLGYALGVPHLFFLFGIFGWGVIGLWGVFALWFAFYLFLGRWMLGRSLRFGPWLLPALWFALEFFRSELYPLRFSWLIPGYALSLPSWLPLTFFGVYGFSLLVMLILAVFDQLPRRWGFLWLVVCSAAAAGLAWFPGQEPPGQGPLVVGMQMESPPESQVLAGLDEMIRKHPEADLLLLSEYTFEKGIPESVLEWCDTHDRYRMAGGRDFVENAADFSNTIFVVSPDGEIVFRQAKAQPIPFFDDGLPAESQTVWESPWGRIGIAICYDLNYARVMDPLVDDHAQALIVPAVDVITWGEWQHELHARIAVVRAREYQLPLFRLASSGVSTFVDPAGRVLDRGSYPGHGEILAARLPFPSKGRLPLDRYAALPIVVGMGLVVVLLFARRASMKTL